MTFLVKVNILVEAGNEVAWAAKWEFNKRADASITW